MKINPEKISWVVFDIDGVLIDVSTSFYEAFQQLVKWYCNRYEVSYDRKVVEKIIYKIKQFPQMNDDWDAGEAVNLIYMNRQLHWMKETDIWKRLEGGELWSTLRDTLHDIPLDFDLMRYELQSIYGGKECERLFGFPPASPEFKGTYRNEKPLIHADTIRNLSVHKIIYTGRNLIETKLALDILGLDMEEFALLLHTDTGYLKPDATPLINWHNQFIEDDEIGLFFGDTAADWQTVKNFMQVKGNSQLAFIGIGEILKENGLPYHFNSVEEAIEYLFRS